MSVEMTLGPLHSIPAGEGRSFQAGTKRIAVFRTRQGELFASQADCPHRGGPLADGLLGGSTLICPLHSLKFDLSTGRSAGGDCTLKMYPTRLTPGGQIVVLLDE